MVNVLSIRLPSVFNPLVTVLARSSEARGSTADSLSTGASSASVGVDVGAAAGEASDGREKEGSGMPEGMATDGIDIDGIETGNFGFGGGALSWALPPKEGILKEGTSGSLRPSTFSAFVVVAALCSPPKPERKSKLIAFVRAGRLPFFDGDLVAALPRPTDFLGATFRRSAIITAACDVRAPAAPSVVGLAAMKAWHRGAESSRASVIGLRIVFYQNLSSRCTCEDGLKIRVSMHRFLQLSASAGVQDG